MVTAPPLFSAPPGSGLGFGIGPADQDRGQTAGCIAQPKSTACPEAPPKNPYFADSLFILLHLPPAIQTPTIVCISFGSLNRYFAYFAPGPPYLSRRNT